MTAVGEELEPRVAGDDAGDLLVRALADNLDAAFEGVVRAYQDRILSYVTRMVGDAGRAEEVVQDVFVRAYRSLRNYDRARIRALRLRAWLYAIASNLARNALRGKRLQTVGLEREDGSERTIADGRATPETQLERAQEWRRVAEAVSRMSPRLRSAFVLRYVEELSYEEIAEALGQPVGTVKSSAHRGLLAVRTFLEDNR